MLYFSSIQLLLLFKNKINWEQLTDSCIFLYLENFKDFSAKYKVKNIENMFRKILHLMSIMFIYGENYVGKQISSNCEDAVRICFLFGKKCKPGQN